MKHCFRLRSNTALKGTVQSSLRKDLVSSCRGRAVNSCSVCPNLRSMSSWVLILPRPPSCINEWGRSRKTRPLWLYHRESKACLSSLSSEPPARLAGLSLLCISVCLLPQCNPASSTFLHRVWALKHLLRQSLTSNLLPETPKQECDVSESLPERGTMVLINFWVCFL